jgi:hypothetical protein
MCRLETLSIVGTYFTTSAPSASLEPPQPLSTYRDCAPKTQTAAISVKDLADTVSNALVAVPRLKVVRVQRHDIVTASSVSTSRRGACNSEGAAPMDVDGEGGVRFEDCLALAVASGGLYRLTPPLQLEFVS